MRSNFFLHLLLLVFILSSCLPSHASKVLGLPDSLTIKGRVLNAGGEVVSDAAIFVEGQREAATTSDVDGYFTVTVGEEELTRLSGNTDNLRDVFYVYAQKDLPQRSAGISNFIELKARGTRNVGDIVLGRAGTVEGVVNILPLGKRMEPAVGARVRIANLEVFTQPDGSFKIEGVPAGLVPITASAKEFSPYKDEIVVKNGEVTALEMPVVLFPEIGLSGVLVQGAALPSADLEATGHPFLRTFTPIGSKYARYIRYHHDPEQVSNSQWYSVDRRFDYNFPGQGAYTLFYQFADELQHTLSPMYQAGVVIDLFSFSKGFIINDGSGRSAFSEVTLHIDIPPAATRMRIAETIELLPGRPWQEPSPDVIYQFQHQEATNFIVIDRPSLRQLFVQFADARGFESVVFRGSVQLSLFDAEIIINQGATFSTNRLVSVELGIPPAANKVRFSDDYLSIEDAEWMDPQELMTYVFSARFERLPDSSSTSFNGLSDQFLYAQGLRTLKVQFKTPGGYVSGVFERYITLDMFPDSGAPPFVLDQGAPVTQNRLVVLDICSPPNAREMRIFEPRFINGGGAIGEDLIIFLPPNINDTSRVWLTARPILPNSCMAQAFYTFQTPGSKILYLQFRDVDRVVSPVYQQAIVVEPFPPQPAGFVFVNVDTSTNPVSTTNPLLDIQLIPPLLATEYRIWEGQDPPPITLEWRTLTPTTQFLVSGPGVKIINVEYRSVEGAESGTYVEAIELLP